MSERLLRSWPFRTQPGIKIAGTSFDALIVVVAAVCRPPEFSMICACRTFLPVGVLRSLMVILGSLLFVGSQVSSAFGQGTHDFGTVALGQSSAVYTISFNYVDSNDYEPLTLKTVAPDFGSATYNCMTYGFVHVNFPVGSTSCSLNVTFKPTGIGQRMGAALLYDSDGIVQKSFFLSGNGSGGLLSSSSPLTTVGSGLQSPRGVAVDAAGNVYIADQNGGVVVKIAPGGAQTTIATLPNVNKVAVDGEGSVYLGADNGPVMKVDVADAFPMSIFAAGQYGSIAVDGAGYVYLGDHAKLRVVRVTSGGGTPTVIASALESDPVGIAVDASGNVYITGGPGSILKVPAGGGSRTTVGTGIVGATGVAVDGAGNVYIADQGGHQIVKVPAGGGAQTTIAAGISVPFGVAVDGFGNLFLTDTQKSYVVEVQQAQPPASPLSLGSVIVGSTGTYSLPLTNIGNAPLALTSALSPSQYTKSDNCNGSIGVNANCTFNLTFTPTTGTATPGTTVPGTLTLTGNIPNSPQVINLTANGITAIPAITTQPQSVPINFGQTATLNVTASGASPLSYQWYAGSSPNIASPIPGATAATYTTPVLAATTNYWVRVSNTAGTADSTTATVTVFRPPVIATQPASVTIASGQTATLIVAATGDGPLSYQWYAGTSPSTAQPVAGATAPSFTTPTLTATASFWVRVTNAAGTADSNTATVTVTPPPTITAQPSSITINSGSTATLTVAATGAAPLTYQWYAGTSPNTAAPVAGAASPSFTTPNLTATASYWVRVTNAAGTADSNTATVTVTPPPTITAQPGSQTINSGSTATLTVAATGAAPLTYQWYAGTSPNTAAPVAGAASPSFTTPNLTATASYWVRVTNAAGTADSNTATVTVTPPPTITAQPGSQTINSGSTATLTVAATGAAPLTYQWYAGTSPNTAAPVAGAASPSFTTPNLTATASYWVRVTNAAGTADSNTATVTVTPPPTITAQPGSQTINSGSTATLTVAATGAAPLTYQWYAGTSPNTAAPVAGAASPSFTTPNLTATASYWVRVTNAAGTADSNTATVTVTPPPTITAQPGSQTINSGSTATLTVAATGAAPLTYQWYAGTSPNTAAPVAGAASPSFTTPNLTATASYWVRVTNAAGTADSNTATVTVTPPPTITAQPGSQTINSGSTATLTVAATGAAPLTYQWYAGTSPNTAAPVAGAASPSFTTPNLTATASYWVRVTNAAGTADSNTATVTVTPPPTITAQPGSQTINSGSTATLTVAATGAAPLTYQWYAGTSPNTAAPVAGAASPSFTTPNLTATASYWVRVTNAAGTADSNTATVTVTPPPTITAQPGSQTINSGSTATLTVAATGAAPLTYQWYAGTSPNTAAPVAGAASPSFTTPNLTATASYWVRVTNAAGTADSNTATVTVTPPPTITAQPGSQTINSGSTATLTVAATGAAPLTYQWYAGTSPNTAAPVAGAASPSFTTPNLTATASYWVRVTNAAGTADSNTATVTVTPPPTITAQPGSQTINSGSTATLTVAATGAAPLTYQWYAGTSPNTAAPVAGAASPSFTTPTLTATASFWVRVTNAAGTADSSTATITVVTQSPACTLTTTAAAIALTVTATATCTDPQNQALLTMIDWGDQTPLLTASTGTHTYGGLGVYTIVATAKNTGGASITTSRSVTLAPAATAVFPGQTSTAALTVPAAPAASDGIVATLVCNSISGVINGVTFVNRSPAVYGISCSSPSFTLSSTIPPQVNLAIHTSGCTAVASFRQAASPAGGWYALTLPLPGLLLFGIGASTQKRRRRGRQWIALGGVSLLILSCVACGGYFSGTGTTTTSQSTNSCTPAVVYYMTVTDQPVTGAPTGFVQTSLIVPLPVVAAPR